MQQLDSELEKNKRIHGSDEFPLDAYVINCDGNENVFDCHFHEEVEFLLVIDGKILFQSGTVYYEIQKDEAVFINSGCMLLILLKGVLYFLLLFSSLTSSIRKIMIP